MNKMIRVWRFEDAPKRYQNLSRNCGDEDWIAVVPKELSDKYSIGWLEQPHFGCFKVERYSHKKFEIYIGCHS